MGEFCHNDIEATLYVTEPGTQAVYLAKEGREKLIQLYEARAGEAVFAGPEGDKVSYRYVFQLQAQKMARFILGQAQQYEAFTVR